MRKNAYVWGCLDGVWGCLGGVWGCLDGVWMVSGWCLSVLNNSGVVGRVVFEIALLSKSPTIRDVLRCLWGVFGVSRWCLGESGYCLGGRNTKSIENNPMTTVLSMYFIFSQWPFLGKKRSSAAILRGGW